MENTVQIDPRWILVGDRVDPSRGGRGPLEGGRGPLEGGHGPPDDNEIETFIATPGTRPKASEWLPARGPRDRRQKNKTTTTSEVLRNSSTGLEDGIVAEELEHVAGALDALLPFVAHPLRQTRTTLLVDAIHAGLERPDETAKKKLGKIR